MNEPFAIALIRDPSPIEVGVGDVIGIESALAWLAKPPLKGILKPRANDLFLVFFEDMVVAYAYVISPRKIRVFPRKYLPALGERSDSHGFTSFRYAWHLAWNAIELPTVLYDFARGYRGKVNGNLLLKLNRAAVRFIARLYENVRDFQSTEEMKFAELLPASVQYFDSLIAGDPKGQPLRKKINAIDGLSNIYLALRNMMGCLSDFIYSPNIENEFVKNCYYILAQVGDEGTRQAPAMTQAMRDEVSTVEFLEFLSENP